MDANEVEFLLGKYISGQADQATKEMIEAWMFDEHHLATFYNLLLKFESNHPVFKADMERALALLKGRLV